ncbi:MAG: ScyD/ScyE family protein [Dermatophilaceae bacterium]
MPLLSRLACATAASVSLAVALAPAASADQNAQHRWTRTLTNKVLTPFQLAVNRGDVYVADGFTSTVSKVTPHGLKTIATGFAGGDVAGLDLSADGRSLAFTSSQYGPPPAAGPPPIVATKLTIKTDGKPDVVADLRAYEVANNPDAGSHYGFGPGASQCARDFIISQLGPGSDSYPGLVDSHPYAVASLGDGSWAVADAGANAILKVDGSGAVSTLAVLPPQPVTVTAQQAAALGAPCLEGETYAFEPVPTDVELGSGGRLWVTTLPGGPEDPSLGARGSLYTVNQGNGRASLVATGFAGATNVGLAGDGSAYVTELFGGKINKVNRSTGKVSTFKQLTNPLSAEVAGNALYVGTMAPSDPVTGEPTGKGTVIRFRLG